MKSMKLEFLFLLVLHSFFLYHLFWFLCFILILEINDLKNNFVSFRVYCTNGKIIKIKQPKKLNKKNLVLQLKLRH